MRTERTAKPIEFTNQVLTFCTESHILLSTEPDTPLVMRIFAHDAYHVGSFNLCGEFMDLKEHQPPLSVEEQIENLKHLGLVIDDDDSAGTFLNDVSYFRFIKAYSLGWKPKNGKYQAGTSFHMLKELYLFNSNFRQLLFPLIERVEINLRCRLANYFCVKYGVLGYMDPANFADEQYHNEFLHDMNIEVERNAKAPFVKNFRQNYVDGTIPLYALVELFSFGTLSKFFKNMKNLDKKAVAKMYNIGYTYFESWIESVAFVRNICAHYGRLYNGNLAKSPMLYKQYQGVSNLRIYAILLCLKQLLPNDLHWIQFVDTLELLIEKYPSVQIQLMGFPENWKELLVDGAR